MAEMRQRGQAADAPKMESKQGDGDAAAAATADGAEGEQKKLHVGRGSKTPDRCRRFLLSTPFKILVLTLVIVVPSYGLMSFAPIALPVLGIEGILQVPIYLIGIWLTVQFIYNFAMSQFTDPGSTMSVKPTYEAIGQYEMVFADDADRGPLTQVDSGEPLLYAPNWCDHCAHWKPPRAHHCSFCRRCTLRMDHHCPFTGNCIGYRNHGHFVLMYTFAILGLAYALALCSLVIYTYPHRKAKIEGSQTVAEMLGVRMVFNTKWMQGTAGMMFSFVMHLLAKTNAQIAIFTVLVIIALVAVLSFGIPALICAGTNTTVLEQAFPMKEFVQIKSSVYCPLGSGFYNRGSLENFRQLLGPNWRWRLLLPTRGGRPDLEVAIAPRPSLAGRDALANRIKEVTEEGVKQQVKNCQELGINPGPDAMSGGVV
eukprot:CAMPEP_0206554366 /NCGR_PEP_ID=MMETSP0325_2-20121206/17147_1 /ASSEMBLY_ACC=CAM_ASM_000347 /TAXON_ID=2866 /ORGANISM="Crypthecodinium cohnii, Strain Seligo" /LENGTH=425 /DNA_ID=CAMNT_0054054445 /DNA_START=47 /DNA_END=1324 /DNA_ORIENTATION=+